MWSSYPEELRDKYSDVLHTQVADGAAGKILVTDELLRETLKDDVLFSQLADDLHKSAEHDLFRSQKAYVSFISDKKHRKMWIGHRSIMNTTGNFSPHQQKRS